MNDLLPHLKAIVGPDGWIDDADAMAPYLSEWRGRWHGRTPLLVRPTSTKEVAAVVAACRDARVGIVPQGGNTGLCGGAIPDPDGTQILLSLGRMNRIREVSAGDFSCVAEAGCTLQSLQQAAEAVERFFPLSLAAEGTCQIGGNISTNAGGINVLRYGTARDQVLGLEVVLADGSVWDGLRSLRKDTAGYDLKQLFIGAEGTLGIITAACLRLYPAIRDPATAIAAIETPRAAVSLLAELRGVLEDRIQAFELIPGRAVRFVMRHVGGVRFPYAPAEGWYVLLETSGGGEAELERALLGTMESGLIREATVAKNRAEAEGFWRLRHAISEAQKSEGASLKHDVSVPVGEIGEFIESAEAAVLAVDPDVRVVAFGHVGDGNVHFNLSQPAGVSAEDFLARGDTLSAAVYSEVARYAGSISAEHGIGQAKRDLLRQYRGETEIALMRRVKSALDPDGIMNPGKVI